MTRGPMSPGVSRAARGYHGNPVPSRGAGLRNTPWRRPPRAGPSGRTGPKPRRNLSVSASETQGEPAPGNAGGPASRGSASVPLARAAAASLAVAVAAALAAWGLANVLRLDEVVD